MRQQGGGHRKLNHSNEWGNMEVDTGASLTEMNEETCVAFENHPLP